MDFKNPEYFKKFQEQKQKEIQSLATQRQQMIDAQQEEKQKEDLEIKERLSSMEEKVDRLLSAMDTITKVLEEAFETYRRDNPSTEGDKPESAETTGDQ